MIHGEDTLGDDIWVEEGGRDDGGTVEVDHGALRLSAVSESRPMNV